MATRGRGRGGRGEASTSVDQLGDPSVGEDAPQTRATGESVVYPGPPSEPPGHAGHGAPCCSYSGTSCCRHGLPRWLRGPSSRARPDQYQGHVPEPPSTQTVQNPAVSCLSKFLTTTTLKDSYLGSTILVWKPADWSCRIYIRIDISGSFHTYPHLGGPFKSLQEAEKSIDCHLYELQHMTMRKESLEELSLLDRLIRQSLFWPDGRKKCSKAFVFGNTQMWYLVQALVDKYNEDHNLFGDLAYELKDVLHTQAICERHIWYHHFNFIAKTKGNDDFHSGIGNLFFAEVTHLQGHELAVSCFCMINTNANGKCYGCTNNGSVDMKHPNEANAYTGGHLDGYLPFGYDLEWDDLDDNVKTEEDRLRYIYKGLDDPNFLENIFTLPPHATAMLTED